MRGARTLSTGVASAGLTLTALAAVAPTQAAGEPGAGVLRLEPVPGSDMRSLDVPLASEVGRRSGPMRTTSFSLLGLTWRGAATPTIRIRTNGPQGWSRWHAIPVLKDVPDPGVEGNKGLRSTQPWWVGPSDGVDVQVDGSVSDLTLALIDPGSSPATGSDVARSWTTLRKPGIHKAKNAPRPRIRTREAWGANEKWRDGKPHLNPSIKQVHIHHTATGNRYSRPDVPRLLRAIYRYHTHNLGWSDLGYNFVVDRFGRLWQGRGGGVGRPVRGAHTLGFNHNSTGVAVLGSYSSEAPKRRVLTAVVRLAAWRLDHYGRKPAGRVTVRSRGSDRFATGIKVRLPVIDGHRDTNDTECPGQRLYDRLPSVRKRAQARADRWSG